MRRISLLLAGLLISLYFQALAQNKPYVPDPDAKQRVLNIDVSHMLLEVRFQPEKGLVIGEVTHTFKPTPKKIDSFFLDGPGIHFKSVQLNGANVPYTLTPAGIVIKPTKALSRKKEYQVHISYEASPRKGIYFIGWDDSTNRSRKQIWTQGEMEDNRYWIPSVDERNDKLVTEVKATIDKQYKVLSNGRLLDTTLNNDNTLTWHYEISHPHSLYLVMLGIGKYSVKADKSGSGVPLAYWYYPNMPEKVEPTYRYTPHIMDYYEKEIGVPFPWGSYSQIPVQNFMYGAMENTTATLFGDFYYVDKREYLDRDYVGVNAHEMAHQWFGDLITGKSGRDQWLQEGFATHYAKLAEWDIFGENYYEWNRRGEENAAISASQKDLMPIANTKAGGARIYQKASFVLDMLTDTVGRDNYNRVVKEYLQKYGYANASTEDFANMFKEVLGLDMDWFFDEWIKRGGEPHYLVQYQPISVSGHPFTQVSIRQVQKLDSFTDYFKMPITVEVYYKDGTSSRKKEWVADSVHIMTIENPLNKAIDFVLFDPGDRVLKKVDFYKNIDELKAQALGAPLMIDRYDAIAAMRTLGFYQKRDFMSQVFAKNPYHPIQEEIVSQLAHDSNAVSQKVLLAALKDDDASVRRRVADEVSFIPDSLRPAYEKLLADSSYNVVEAALKKLTSLYPQYTGRYLAETDGLQGMSRNVRITWLKIAIQESNSEKLMRELVDYASPSYEFRTRLNAFDALRDLNHWDQTGMLYLLEAATSWNSRMANPAKEVIQSLLRDGKRTQLKEAFHAGRWDETERDILTKLLG